MRQDHSILQELSSIAPMLAGVPKPGTGSVPEGYFSELQDAVWAGVQPLETDQPGAELAALTPVLASIKVLGHESEPIDFNALQQSVISEVLSTPDASPQEELEVLAPVLSAIPKQEAASSVPEHYFSELQQEVLQKTGSSGQTTHLLPRVHSNRWFRWSAAASVLLLLVAGWWWMQQAPGTGTSTGTNESLALTEEEILQYLSMDQEGLDEGMLLALDNSIADAAIPEKTAPDKEEIKKYNNKNANPKLKSGSSVEQEEIDQLLNELDTDDLENLF